MKRRFVDFNQKNKKQERISASHWAIRSFIDYRRKTVWVFVYELSGCKFESRCSHIWINPVFFVFTWFSLKTKTFPFHAHIGRKGTLPPVCRFFSVQFINVKKMTNDRTLATEHNFETLKSWQKTTWRIIYLKKFSNKDPTNVFGPGPKVPNTATDLHPSGKNFLF